MDDPDLKCVWSKRAPWFLGVLVALVAGVAVWAYPQLKTRRLVEGLRDPGKRFQTQQRLIESGPEVVPYLIEVVEETGHPGRREAIEVLGRKEDPRALDAILAVDDPELAVERLHALGAIRGPRALGEVLAALDGDDLELELAALVVLRRWPDADEATVPKLTPYLTHHFAGARALACEGLGQRRYAPSEPVITELMRDPEEPPRVREAAAGALLQIGTPSARAAVDAAYQAGLVTLETE